MSGFLISNQQGLRIRCRYYETEAPQTCRAFRLMLPFSLLFWHARVSGEEVWAGEAHSLDIPQENASVFTVPGEIVLGPLHPQRTKTSRCFGIYYGDGRGLDACNIFGRAVEEDLSVLKDLGLAIWKNGAMELTFSAVD